MTPLNEDLLGLLTSYNTYHSWDDHSQTYYPLIIQLLLLTSYYPVTY